MVTNHDTWHWQEPGTAWKGVGIYHVTLTIPSREPLLGSLVIPDNDPKRIIYIASGTFVPPWSMGFGMRYKDSGGQ